MSDIGSTPSLEPVTEENILDLISSAQTQSTQHEEQPPQQEQPAQDDGPADGGTNSEAVSSAKTPSKVHTCGFCGIVFKTYPALVEHRATHGGSRPYECHVCDKRFTQKAHLIIHRRTHTGEKPYACHICHKRFSQTSHLNSHKRVHSGEKPYFCSLCNMGFCRRRRLEVHLQQHAKDMEQGLAHNPAAPQHSRLGLAGAEAAKDFLVSMGLGTGAGAMDRAGGLPEGSSAGGSDVAGSGDGQSRCGSSSSSAKRVSSGMAVFPGFHMGEEEAAEEGENGEEEEVEEEVVGEKEEEERGGASVAELNNHDSETPGGQTLSRSPTPSSCHSQGSAAQTSTPKSRRKPAFVRKLGSARPKKAEAKEDSGSASGKGGESGTDARQLELSAQEAAVKAMIRMATGSDCDDVGDVSLSDVAGLDASISSMLLKQSFFGVGAAAAASSFASQLPPVSHDPRNATTKFSAKAAGVGRSSASRHPASSSHPPSNSMLSSLIRTNNRVSLVDFTAEDLLRHLMSRDDVYRCDFCCVIFHDAAMYHLHRSMHDKMDIRCCNLCGKLLMDKYDFTAHFLSQHKQ